MGFLHLKSILQNGYEVPAVVTVPDKQKGRGLKVQFSDVKKFALENNIEVLQPKDLKDESFIKSLIDLNPDLFVIIAFRILPNEIFKIPKLGSINLHASLLPKYRGAAPINHAIINGESISGLTTFFLDDRVDTGNIIMQKEIAIDINDTFGDVYNRMSEEGSELVIETIEQIKSNNCLLKKQENSQATKAPKIFKDFCRIDWNKDALTIHNFVRGLSPVPAAFSISSNKIFKILKTSLTDTLSVKPPGTLIIDSKKLYISTKDKDIEVLTIQPEGKKPMTAIDFINGFNKTSTLEFN